MAGKGLLNAVEDGLDWAVNGVKKVTKGIVSNGDVAGQPGLFKQGLQRLSPGGAIRMNGDEVAERLIKDVENVPTRTLSPEKIKEVHEAFPGMTDDEVIDMLRETDIMGTELANRADTIRNGGLFEKAGATYDGKGGYGQTVKNFYTGADVDTYKRTTAAARIGATAMGLHVGGSIMRLPTGGNAQYNSRGERDIAGIPFI